jgi:hypothetical protein
LIYLILPLLARPEPNCVRVASPEAVS